MDTVCLSRLINHESERPTSGYAQSAPVRIMQLFCQLAVVIVVLLAATPARATTYYLATAGDGVT
jgi:hypothetical protein